jgi:hypothetical protein
VEVASFEPRRSEQDLQELSPWLDTEVLLERAHVLERILHPKAGYNLPCDRGGVKKVFTLRAKRFREL